MAAFAAALDPSSVPSTKAESNRRNAERSTGPRTPEGKQASARNAIKHGLFASLKNLPPAEREIFDLIASGIPHAVSCDDAVLLCAARELALQFYRRDHVRRLEFSTYADRMRVLCEAEGIPEPTDSAARGLLEARIFREDALGPRILTKLHTQERFFTREIEKAMERYQEALLGYEPRDWQPGPEPESPADLASFFENAPDAAPAAAVPAQPARSAPCPCGSGLKYKRCCGLNAPPQLHRAA